jgi:hypothetical protein
MIRNKALHAMIIGTCIFVGSMTGVYADAAAPDTPVSIQIEQVNTGNQLISEDTLKNKQNEIDQYVFEKHAKEFADKGITVTNTGVVIGDYVEVTIVPFNEENANFVYDIFGKELVQVVEGVQAATLGSGDTMPEVIMQLTGGPADATIVSAPSEK